MSDSRPLNRQNDPPPRGPKVEVWRPSPELGVKGWVLSAWFWGTYIHWNSAKRRTQECLEDPETCPGCIDHLEQKWKGYLTVLTADKQKIGFLELTRDAANQMLDLLQDRKNIRGLYIEVRRAGRTSNARLAVSINPYIQTPDPLPLDKDPEETLRLMWNWVKPTSKKSH